MTGDTASFERIFNFRDYGGYAMAGGRLATGRLFRSGHHHGASPADLAFFSRHGVETVIDLRGDSERASFPCARDAGFAGDVLFAPGETDGREPGVSSVDFEDAAVADRHMIEVYARLPFLPSLSATYRLFLTAVAERSGASMVHCFAGKDRTGIAVALVHLLAGVHHDDMMDDYLRSNDPTLIERCVAIEGPVIRAQHGARSDAALRRMFGVDPRFLESALGAMTARHGSVAGYADDVLGMTPARLDRWRMALLA